MTTCPITLGLIDGSGRTLPCGLVPDHDGVHEFVGLGDHLRDVLAVYLAEPEPAEPATVASVVEWLAEAAETLSGLLDDLYELKRAGSDEARRTALLVAADQTSRAWSYARMALTTLTTDVKP